MHTHLHTCMHSGIYTYITSDVGSAAAKAGVQVGDRIIKVFILYNCTFHILQIFSMKIHT